jgi:LacI family transcriptional regulator
MATHIGHKPDFPKRVTLSDIAEKSNVSLTTVSLVLRNKSGVGIPVETRQRVLETARGLGYRMKVPVEIRQGVNQIGVVLKAHGDDLPLTNPFIHTSGGYRSSLPERMNLLSATLPVAPTPPTDLPRFVEEEHVDGLLLVGAFVDQTLDHLLGEKSIPVVLVDAYSESNAYDAVVTENYQGAFQAVSYLIEHGHRHIAIVGSQHRAYPSIRERRRAYEDALQDHGITETYYADCHLIKEEAYTAVTRLLQDNPQLTAVFCVNDDIAMATIRAAHGLGKRLPQDLSIIGFDDFDLAHLTHPPLTTMQVDKINMGRMAVQLLLNRAHSPDLPRVTMALRTRLIERQSVRDIR